MDIAPIYIAAGIGLLLCTHAGIAFVFYRNGVQRGYLKRQFDERDREFRAVHF